MNKDDLRVHRKVLMVGPDLSLHGGIVTVVQGYLEVGLPDICDGFRYLGTGVGFSKIGKTAAFAKALLRFISLIPVYDIVHLHISARGSYRRKSIMARIAHRMGRVVILHEHDGEFKKAFEEGDDAYRRNVRKTFGIADRVVVLSEEWGDYFAEKVCDPKKIIVIHNGVSIPTEPCCPCSSRDVLFLGSLDARKSPDVLLRASREVLERFPDAKIVLGGDGEVEVYRRLAEKLGIEGRCEFCGWVSGSKREELFGRAAVYCLPSKNEGLPMSVLEAMARGIPTIATPVGGIPQVIKDGVNGYLMPVDDEEKLCDLLCKLMNSGDLRASIGVSGRTTVSDFFNIERNVEELVQLYKELMA